MEPDISNMHEVNVVLDIHLAYCKSATDLYGCHGTIQGTITDTTKHALTIAAD